MRLSDIGGWDSMNAVTFSFELETGVRRVARRNHVQRAADPRRGPRDPARARSHSI
jgi:hypothetical protein